MSDRTRRLSERVPVKASRTGGRASAGRATRARATGGWRYGIWLLLVALVVCGGCQRGPAPAENGQPTVADGTQQLDNAPSTGNSTNSQATDTQAAAIRVRVLRGPAAEIIEGTVVWQAEMTVFDVISRFSPSLDVESTGQGEALFVKSIAGQKNLGSAGDNWIYRVNGQLGDRSCGVYPVAAGDEVVWSFGKYE